MVGPRDSNMMTKTYGGPCNIEIMLRKIGQISKAKVFSSSLMMHNLFQIIIRGHLQALFTPRGGFMKLALLNNLIR